MKILFAIIVLVTSCSLEPKEEIYLGLRWSEVETLESFTPRRNFGVVYLNNTIVVIGGFIKKDSALREELANDVWHSTDEGRTWKEVKPNSTSPTDTFTKRQDFASVVIDGIIYIIGGYGDAGVYLNDVWKSADLGITWERVVEEAEFSKRYGHKAVVLNNKDIYVIGGGDLRGCFNDVWKSTDLGITWVKVDENKFRARRGFGALSYKNEIFLVGGNDSKSIITDILLSEEQVTLWYRQPNAPFEFFEHSITSVGNDIFVIENDYVWKTIDGGIKWSKVLYNSDFKPRRGAALINIDRKIILIGGISDEDNQYLNDVWESKY